MKNLVDYLNINESQDYSDSGNYYYDDTTHQWYEREGNTWMPVVDPTLSSKVDDEINKKKRSTVKEDALTIISLLDGYSVIRLNKVIKYLGTEYTVDNIKNKETKKRHQNIIDLCKIVSNKI